MSMCLEVENRSCSFGNQELKEGAAELSLPSLDLLEHPLRLHEYCCPAAIPSVSGAREGQPLLC